MINIVVKITSPAEIKPWLEKRLAGGNALLYNLFGAEKLACCEEILLATHAKGEIVGLVALSAKGGAGEGPEIVGVYVEPTWRRLGIGRALLIQAVEHMAERGLAPVRLNLLNQAIARVYDTLPESVKEKIVVGQRETIWDPLISKRFISQDNGTAG